MTRKTTQTLPRDTLAEYMVLGSCFYSAENCTYVLEQVKDSDFQDLEMKMIFGLIKRHAQTTPVLDVYELIQRAKAENLTASLNVDTLLRISTSFSSSYEEYLERLKTVSFKRNAVGYLQDAISDFCKEDSDYEVCVDELQNKLISQYARKNEKIMTSQDIDADFQEGICYEKYLLDMVEKVKMGGTVIKGIPTNYSRLDETIGGFQNGSLTYVGARSHMGKTTFLLNLLAQMGPQVKAGVMTLEMPIKALYENFVSLLAVQNHADASSGKLTDAQVRSLIHASRVARNYETCWEQYGEASINWICVRAKKLLMVKNIQILFIDYLTCISGGKTYSNKHAEVTDISKRLQGLSKELNIPIVCLAQLNRESAKRGERPQLTDFRESGSIEQDADTCLLLHRPAYYDKYHKPGIMEVHVAKNRLMKHRRTIDFVQIDGKERMMETEYFDVEMEAIRKNNEYQDIFSK